MLKGKETDKIWQFEHHHLPTFGVGDALDNNQWRSVFRQLVGGAIYRSTCRASARSSCKKSAGRCCAVSVRLHCGWTRSKVAKRQTKTLLPEDINVGLWEALRDCRRELAEEQGVPPYVIFMTALGRDVLGSAQNTR